ncbi:MAG: hypothetical protein IJU79_05010 [Desulfovibrionaceae bacterium]|nr:hypothetical protein [Desulfovibrionaceae bacterium]
MAVGKTGVAGTRKDGRVKSAEDIVESKSVCLPGKFWKKLKKEGGDLSVTKYAGQVLIKYLTEEDVQKVAFVYDIENNMLQAILFGTNAEISEYWHNNYNADTTLYTCDPTSNFADVKVIHVVQEKQQIEPTQPA